MEDHVMLQIYCFISQGKEMHHKKLMSEVNPRLAMGQSDLPLVASEWKVNFIGYWQQRKGTWPIGFALMLVRREFCYYLPNHCVSDNFLNVSVLFWKEGIKYGNHFVSLGFLVQILFLFLTEPLKKTKGI